MTLAAVVPFVRPFAGTRDLEDLPALAPLPGGDFSSLLFFERTLPQLRKEALQSMFDGRRMLARLSRVLDRAPDILPPHMAVTSSPTHRGLAVHPAHGRMLVVNFDDRTLCAGIEDHELRIVLLDGALPFSNRQVRYRPHSELEAAETLAAVCCPQDHRFIRTDASRLADRFVIPPDLEAGYLLGVALDSLGIEPSVASVRDDIYQRCIETEASLIADWARQRAVVSLLQRAWSWVRACGTYGTLILDNLLLEETSTALRLSSPTAGTQLSTSIELLRCHSLNIVISSWDDQQHTLAMSDGRLLTPLPPLDAMLDLAVELDDLQHQLEGLT